MTSLSACKFKLLSLYEHTAAIRVLRSPQIEFMELNSKLVDTMNWQKFVHGY